jgi:hypothetical protein
MTCPSSCYHASIQHKTPNTLTKAEPTVIATAATTAATVSVTAAVSAIATIATTTS